MNEELLQLRSEEEIQRALAWVKEHDVFQYNHGAEGRLRKYPFFFCHICGAPERATYVEERRRILLEHQICFTCSHWKELLPGYLSGKRFISKGGCYTPCADPGGPDDFKGFGGRKFRFRVFAGPRAGEILETTNMWHQGTVSQWWRDQFPDNCEFLPTGGV